MRTVNKVILIGNITRDPVIKDTENGKKLALFTIATNRYYKTTDGENKSESEFHNCVTWGALAERVEQFLLKGKLVYGEGRLKTRVIDKEDGTKLYKTEVVISNLIFLNKKSDFDDDMDSSSDMLNNIDYEDSF
ncbi:single-stranded DNA-binding protein [Candidatus Gracilibacteria bacterium]|nr:MAG: single-stranded DNA-binding protein [Candidatus Gracilibacteria bacterium]